VEAAEEKDDDDGTDGDGDGDGGDACGGLAILAPAVVAVW